VHYAAYSQLARTLLRLEFSFVASVVVCLEKFCFIAEDSLVRVFLFSQTK